MISSSSSVTGTNGRPFRYEIKASNAPARFNATDLPAGLIVDRSTGLISGRPDTTGTFLATISAINVGGTGSASLTVTILPAPPVITSSLNALATNGLAFHYQIAARGNPVSFDATGLPNGLSVNTATGLISGTAAVNGRFPVTISASNAGGTGFARLALTVNFSGVRGSYESLVTIGGTDAGLFTLSLSPTGAFTGRLTLAGARYPLKGTFSSTGTFAGTEGAGAGALDVALTVNPAALGISGTITGGTNSYNVESSRLGTFKPGTLSPGLPGTYTAMISPAVSSTDPTLPQAPGYATMSVTARGAVHLAGKLGDGTPFGAAGQLQSDGKTCSLFTLLYNKTNPGSIAGNITFENAAGSDFDGALAWIKPAQTGGAYYPGGFSMNVDLLAAKYAPPPLMTSGAGSFILGGGDLPAHAISDSVTIPSGDVVTVSGTNGVTVTLTRGTGAFSGQFLYPGTNRKTGFGGVIYQKPAPPAGYGLFRGPDQSGEVEISP